MKSIYRIFLGDVKDKVEDYVANLNKNGGGIDYVEINPEIIFDNIELPI